MELVRVRRLAFLFASQDLVDPVRRVLRRVQFALLLLVGLFLLRLRRRRRRRRLLRLLLSLRLRGRGSLQALLVLTAMIYAETWKERRKSVREGGKRDWSGREDDGKKNKSAFALSVRERFANREGRRRRERETRSDRFRGLSVELSRLASTPFASSIDGRALRARARPRSSPERRRPPSLVPRTGTRAPRGALEKLGAWMARTSC